MYPRYIVLYAPAFILSALDSLGRRFSCLCGVRSTSEIAYAMQ